MNGQTFRIGTPVFLWEMKYSAEITEEICKYLRAGNSQKDSATLAGIHEDTFYTWMKEHDEFSESIKKAEQECKARNIALIQKAAEKSWQAAAWYLERKYNNEFALKQISEMQGQNGEAIKVIINHSGFIPKVNNIDESSSRSA